MTITQVSPPIVQVAQSKTILEAAQAYAALGFSILPLKGKRPALPSWAGNQQGCADFVTINTWYWAHQLENVGIVCGAVSNNLVVLDIDGVEGYPAFAAKFSALAETYTVATGSGVGKHIYWQSEVLPESIKAMSTPIGNLELCANGRQVVAVPSIHPDSKQPYRVEKALDILRVPNLDEVVAWIASFKAQSTLVSPRINHIPPNGDTKINPLVIRELERYFLGHGYKVMGDWLHGSCVHTQNHKHGDRNPSFGFNRASAYGFCYVCGTLLAKDLCEAVGIDVSKLGGLIEKSQFILPQHNTTVKMSDMPVASTSDEPHQLEIAVSAPSQSLPLYKEGVPPEVPENSVSISQLKLPNWLQKYLDWAGSTGNQTPMSFHLAAGLWLLSVAIGRRLYGEAPWGVKIYPNLYLMLIADTTYYRKSTAYKLAEEIARSAIPHMLMPTPGSPERFQEAQAGRLPANFDKLTKPQQERMTKAQPFAAQRGLLKDEVAGLFGAINRKDYMVGLKDMLMELYDCPDYSDKDTQSGLTVVENAALSILGVTTPAGLSAAVSDADWANGLLIRFSLLTPESDYQERPALKHFQPPPPELVEGLRRLHGKLPQPQLTEEGLAKPDALKLNVECWEACQEYSAILREQCNPRRENELDERLKGVYGRMHIQAFKLVTLLAALEWMDADKPAPTVTQAHWENGKAIAELWRASAGRLLGQLDRSGEAVQERREQDRLLQAIRKAGSRGCNLRDLYRNLNLSAKRARQLAQDLVRAGLVVETLVDRAEWYIAAEFIREN